MHGTQSESVPIALNVITLVIVTFSTK